MPSAPHAPAQARLRFYAELNDFLRPEQRGKWLVHAFWLPPSVKDAIEALGIPHTEVDLILRNGESVDFTALLQNGDEVSVFPVFEALDISPVLKVRPQPLRLIRFVVDVNLGRLATLLRLVGFDTLYRNDYGDAELADISVNEHRILLSRDRALLKRRRLTHAYYLRNTDPSRQLREVLQRFDLRTSLKPFSRCLRCNGEVAAVPSDTVADVLPPKVRARHHTFFRCQQCGHVYWRGTHYQRMSAFLARTCGT